MQKPRRRAKFLPALRTLLPSARASTALVILLALPSMLFAAKVVLKDGRELTGKIATITGVGADPLDAGTGKGSDPVGNTPILLIDNDLTRVMVSKREAISVNEGEGPPLEKILLPQPVARGGLAIGGVGPIREITPFDDFGRRTFSMMTSKGQVDVVQGITEITAEWCRVEGLLGRNSYVWDMRIATSSIPRETLSRILAKRIDPKKPDQRLQIVRLLIQGERYKDAQAELAEIVEDFPSLDALKAEVVALQRMSAKRILTELEVRRKAGQHGLVLSILKSFPTEGVPGESLVQIHDELQKYEATHKEAHALLAEFDKLLALTKDKLLAQAIASFRLEIGREMSFNTLTRLAAFKNLLNDAELLPEEKLALAVSGWLVGADEATDNIKVAMGLLEVRDKVRRYLEEPQKLERDKLIAGLVGSPYFTPKLVASLVANMRPPLTTEPQATPGFYELSVSRTDKDPDVTYFVQLPPEYDPHYRYPVVITLNGGWTTPQQQLDWWAGPLVKGVRQGQGGRQGYIVVAPNWSAPHQKSYEYSAREHGAVLSTLRDACRRFSIDTDRVFLSGHSMGGDAAWDIGLAHPDLWAGVIPIVATADKYVNLYHHNAKSVPLYFVGGELDGDRMVRNAMSLDRYLKPSGFDATVVEFLGRGHENFSDEILRIFDWMGRKERKFFTKGFQAVSMRPWDNFFYWLEVRQFPPRGMVEPSMWPPGPNVSAVAVSGAINQVNGINVKAPGGKVTVWLSPEMIPLDGKPLSITINGALQPKSKTVIQPDLTVLLEDVRTRGDRKHPFWAKYEP